MVHESITVIQFLVNKDIVRNTACKRKIQICKFNADGKIEQSSYFLEWQHEFVDTPAE